MTMLPVWKTCPTCKRQYSWNPDVGQGLYCPHCTKMGQPPKNTLEWILRKNKDSKKKK